MTPQIVHVLIYAWSIAVLLGQLVYASKNYKFSRIDGTSEKMQLYNQYQSEMNLRFCSRKCIVHSCMHGDRGGVEKYY